MGSPFSGKAGSPALVRSDDLRRANMVRILRAVRHAQRISRTELAQATALSPATISTITAALIGERALREQDAAGPAPRRGRPQVALGLDPRGGLVATVALSLNTARFALYDFAGAEIHVTDARIETLKANPGEITRAIAYALSGMMAELPGTLPPVRQVSLGVQGVTDTAGRTMLWSPITKGEVRFADDLERLVGIPVTVANDSDATAIALRHTEPERYGGDFVSIAMTDGIGMSMFVGGQLFSGVRSSAAEFGHMVHHYDGALCRCGRRGCIEAYAGDYAIHRAAHGIDPHATPRNDIDRDEFSALSQAAMAADGPERRAFLQAARALGVGLRNVFALIDPAPVALVGFGGAGEALLEPELRSILKDAFAVSGRDDIQISWHPHSAPLINRGAAERGLELLEQRIGAASASHFDEGMAAAE
ncbi:MAG: ROK family transcriptional regulator [Rhizobiaceae bacterium]|jgi:predicted NBD/HSP70 family sugar kinase|nr:ROK family transcriptional regulator [Rhizobiaceae bacterium]